MGKKTLGVLTIVLIAGLLAGWYFFTRESKYISASAFKAVPVDSPVILRIHDLSVFLEKAEKNATLKEYSKIPFLSTSLEGIHFADSLIINNQEAKKSLNSKDLTVVTGSGNNNSSILYLLELSSVGEKSALSGLINDYFTKKSASSVKQKYGEASMLTYYWSSGPSTTTFSVSFYKGICMASTDTAMVAGAIKQLDLPSLAEDPEFQKVNKTAASNSDLNIYLNHKTLPNALSSVISETLLKRINYSPQHEWSEIDLNHKSNELLFNGFTFGKDSLNDFKGILLHQKPGKFTLENYFPDETSFFLCLNLEKPTVFFKDYEELLRNKGGLDAYKQGLNKVDSTYGINLQKLVAENIEGEVGIVFTQANHSNPSENRFFVMRTHSGSQIEASMLNLVKTVIHGKKSNLKELTQLFSMDKETSYKIYQLPVPDVSEKIFGKIFADVATNYFTVYDNCLIMGASYESLCDFLRSDLLKETLRNNQYYKDFITGLSQRLSLYLWIAPGEALPFFQRDLKEAAYKKLESQIGSLKKIESVGWQLGAENGMIYNVAKLKYNPVIRNKPTTVWRSHLDSKIKFKPQFVINQNEKENREVVVQDIDNKLYLINKEGRILWKIKLPGPILSEVFQVNYFKDKKLQYLFNTRNAIHMLDRDGNYIKGYPVSLRADATNGISLFDYENNLDYRIFVACEDHKVYAYDKKGRIVTGWVPVITEHDVTNPIQYFRIAGKDYLVFFDKQKSYFLDRQGKQRVKSKEEFTHSQNGFTLVPPVGKNSSKLVTTDQDGAVYFLGFDGSVKLFSPGKFSPQHYFRYEDLNNDGHNELIYLDGDSLSVYDDAGKLIFTKKFKNPLDSPPQIYTFPSKIKKIGVVNTVENQVYLFNSDGSAYEGFPLEGNSGFNMGFFNRDNRHFNLIVGSKDDFLYNYFVK
jgi:hypothetical protein